ncbi:hypothetical protein VTN96DRAFT_9610 [Rasamsonia emersonii]
MRACKVLSLSFMHRISLISSLRPPSKKAIEADSFQFSHRSTTRFLWSTSKELSLLLALPKWYFPILLPTGVFRFSLILETLDMITAVSPAGFRLD